MDTNKALADAEISIRNLIGYKLNELYGSDWITKCGIDSDRLEKWELRRVEEIKRLGIADTRLLYYSEFYELLPILKRHWSNCFAVIFGKLNKFEVLWEMLEGYRNPEAHKRGFLPYQTNLIIGISGKIRTEITRYFSTMNTGESYFPRLESVQDSLGNVWNPINGMNNQKRSILRPGDTLTFIVSAFDPIGEELQYSFSRNNGFPEWTGKSNGVIEIGKDDVRKDFSIQVCIKSNREFHASRAWDDTILFFYDVLPPL